MSASKKITQFAPPTGRYKVFVKDKGLWPKYNSARLQISVGNPKHDGDKFFALTEWTSARFDHVTLVVSDTLQRHNAFLKGDYHEDAAFSYSLKQGDEWLDRNRAAIGILPSKTIMRWDQWLQHPDYRAVYNLILALYERNEIFRKSIQNHAYAFCGKDQTGEPDRVVRASIDYLLEELSVFALMFREGKAIDIYPGTWLRDLFSILKYHQDKPLLAGFGYVECLSIDFIRNQSFLSSQSSGSR